MITYPTTTATAAFWIGYWFLASGYGLSTMLQAARGSRGKETAGNWHAQHMAQEYFLDSYAFPKWASWVLLSFTVGTIASFVGVLITWSLKSPFLALELFSVGALSLAASFPLRKPKRMLLERILQQEESQVIATIKEMTLEAPTWLLDVGSLRPSLVGISFLLTTLLGGVFLYEPGVLQEMSISANLSIWIIEIANLFSIPIFLGYSLLGTFSWPAGSVEDRIYYPLLVLQRDLNRRKQ